MQTAAATLAEVVTSDRVDPRAGALQAEGVRNPATQAAAPEGNQHGVHVGQVLVDLQPRGSVAHHDLPLLDRVDEAGVEPRMGMADDRLPPLRKGLTTISAPSAAMDRRLFSGEVSGTTTVQGTPRSRAMKAAAWAQFPALAVITPRESSASLSEPKRLAAARILKQAKGWRFSSFSQISSGPSTGSRTSGVRTA